MSEHAPNLKSRRELLGLLGGVGAAIVLVGCGKDAVTGGASSGSGASSTTAAATATTGAPATTLATNLATLARIPSETGGPFPADGTNGPNVLNQSGVVRSDIRPSFGSSSGVAKGLPLVVNLTIVDSKNGGKPIPGSAVYLWHCDIDGNYSLYSQGTTNQNYLRGVQQAGSDGTVSFTSIFPAAYSGRWPHIHFEVFPTLAAATAGQTRLVTSQLALPADVCKLVFATDGYSRSVSNLAQTSLDRDNVFSDGYSLQVPTMIGSTAAGYTATLPVAV